jgi:AraC-like DNA-binding protein
MNDQECLYIVENRDADFSFPVHMHEAWELTFIQGGKGLTRIIGDSVETIDDLEVVLLTQYDMRHAWRADKMQPHNVREVKMQFYDDLISPQSLGKRHLREIDLLFERAKRGLTFSDETKKRVAEKIDLMLATEDNFEQLLRFMNILHILSLDTEARVLCSESFAEVKNKHETSKLHILIEYLRQHYQEVVRLGELAKMVGMTEVSLSRYFRRNAGVTISDYLIGLRVGHASRLLVDTDLTVNEIAYACGFNNISNFNRLFRKNRGCTPQQLRNMYTKSRVII